MSSLELKNDVDITSLESRDARKRSVTVVRCSSARSRLAERVQQQPDKCNERGVRAGGALKDTG